MTTIILQRTIRKGKAVIGQIGIPLEQRDYTVQTCTVQTLENADYLIPAGIYPLKRTWSPKFKKPLPLIDEVPDREGIRIHLGTKPEHSTGCVLTNNEGMDLINVLFNQQKKWYDEEEMLIDVRDVVDA